MGQTSRLLSWPRAQGLSEGAQTQWSVQPTHPPCLFGAAREKWPQLEPVIFIAHLLKMPLPGAPPQDSRAGTFMHSSSWYPTLQCEDGEPWSRGEQSHLSSLTERLRKAKELYFCKHASDRSSTGMVRASRVNHPAVLL